MVKQLYQRVGTLQRSLGQSISLVDLSVQSTRWFLKQQLVQCPSQVSLARDLVLPIHLVNKRSFNDKMVNKIVLLTISVLTKMVWGMGKRF